MIHNKMNADDIKQIQGYLYSITVTDEILYYITDLCEATRQSPMVDLGVSPRGVQALTQLVRARAILKERDYVIPEDVQAVFIDVCAHRLVMKPQAKIEGVTAIDVLTQMITDGELYDYGKHGQDVNEVSGLRDYIEGDSPRSIHWKLSSKLDDLVVREFGYPSNYHTLILYQMSKETKNRKISNNLNNGVLSLSASLSYSILEKNLEHQVGCIDQNGFQSNPVTTLSNYDQMILNLLCKPIEKHNNSYNIVYQFLHENLMAQYTKIIYITPEYDEISMRELARSVDLTIIQVVEGKKPEHISINGFSVISINIDDYDKKIHNISI